MTLKTWPRGQDCQLLFMICVAANVQTNLRWLTLKNRGPRTVKLKMNSPKSYGWREEMIKPETQQKRVTAIVHWTELKRTRKCDELLDKREHSHLSGEANFSLTFNVSTNSSWESQYKDSEARNRHFLQRLLQKQQKHPSDGRLLYRPWIKAEVLGMSPSAFNTAPANGLWIVVEAGPVRSA